MVVPTRQFINGRNGYSDICGECGRKYGMHLKNVMGLHLNRCAICGFDTGVGNALHDFGMSEEEVMAAREAEGTYLE
jgi:hypothetical protein